MKIKTIEETILVLLRRGPVQGATLMAAITDSMCDGKTRASDQIGLPNRAMARLNAIAVLNQMVNAGSVCELKYTTVSAAEHVRSYYIHPKSNPRLVNN